MCSKQDISCAPGRTFNVFQARHLLCSKQDNSCVPSKTFNVFQGQPFLCSKHDISSAHLIISSYHHILISSCQPPRGKSVSRLWAKSQRKKRNSSLNPFTKKRRDLKFGTSVVIFRREFADNTQKFIAPP